MANFHPGARKLSTQHISIRVPWHDNAWNGCACQKPLANTSCLVLKNIAEERNDDREKACAGRSLQVLDEKQWPPCVQERATFMAPFELTRTIKHVYSVSSKDSHGHLLPTKYVQPPWSAPAIPFLWLMREQVEGDGGLAARFQLGYQSEREPILDFNRAKSADEEDKAGDWVNERENQICLLDTFYSAVKPDESLCFFYAKRTPLAPDDARRVLVGVGYVKKLGEFVEYASSDKKKLRAITFERNVHHSIRPDFKEGFLLPYQAVLEAAEKNPEIDPAACVAFVPGEDRAQFSFVTEHVTHDSAIAALLSCAGALQRTKGVVPGPWDQCLAWIDKQLNVLWQMRGPCPGLGSALAAFGVPNATLVAHDIASAQARKDEWNEDPWPLFEAALEDPSLLSGDLGKNLGKDIKRIYKALKDPRRALLRLLSRFALTEEQAKRFYTPSQTDAAAKRLLQNPYLIFEEDRGRLDSVDLITVDRGLFPEAVVRDKHPLPEPSALEGPLDPRRVRAFVIEALESAAEEGHTLQLREQVVARVRAMDVQPAVPLSEDVLGAITDDALKPFVHAVELKEERRALQLDRFEAARKIIKEEVDARLRAPVLPGKHDFRALVDKQFGGARGKLDPEEERARQEKAAALEVLFTSRLSVLVGAAGTGKTTLLKALCDIPEVAKKQIELLAPTGKARVRLEQATDFEEGKTLAQFLRTYKRWDGETGRYFPNPKHTKRFCDAKTVIIDECSMLTEEQLAATIDALSGVDRLVLVGDPRQLPPIGSGRPFVDLVAHLASQDVEGRFPRVAKGYAELTVSRRHLGKEPRDDIALAQWFSGRPVDAGADEMWERIESGSSSCLSLVEWNSPAELEQKLLDAMKRELKLTSLEDEDGFGVSLGGSLYNSTAYFWAGRDGNPGAAAMAEAWQILSPVHAGQHGVDALNRLLQARFRARARKWANPEKYYERRTCKPVGPQGILYGDKVMSLVNDDRYDVYPGKKGDKVYVANGDIGIVVGQFKTRKFKGYPWKLQVEFTTRPGLQVGFWPSEFGEERQPPLELAYALTVHKTQGSEFGRTFVILPNPCRLLTRELIYTALTRQKDRIVLFHQGPLRDYLKYADGHQSEVARRLTNLFEDPRPVELDGKFFEESLIHRTARGELVRSKSEVIVADRLEAHRLDYRYEAELKADDGTRRYPDFTIEDGGVTVYWEHLGMLMDASYKERWNRKLAWYAANGIPLHPDVGPNGTLVFSTDSPHGGIDSQALDTQIKRVFGR